MPKLENGEDMFYMCIKLPGLAIDLPKLVNGQGMFYNCSVFENGPTSLESLQNGTNMFEWCKLNKTSVLRILNSLPVAAPGGSTISLGMKGEGDDACLILDSPEGTPVYKMKA